MPSAPDNHDAHDYAERIRERLPRRLEELRVRCGLTDPNSGTSSSEHTTRGTPAHYAIKDDLKRSFQLGLVLIGGGHTDEGIKIMTAALDHFPIGNAGQDGAHAAEPSALILSGF